MGIDIEAFRKMWRKDKILFTSFSVSMASLFLMGLIAIDFFIQSLLNPTASINRITSTLTIIVLLGIPVFMGMYVIQYRTSSKTVRIEKEIKDLSTQKNSNKILTAIQGKKHKIFYYLNEESIKQLISQTRGDISPKSVEIKENNHFIAGITAGLPNVGAQANSGQSREQRMTYEFNPTMVNQFVEIQKVLFEENEVTFDLSEIDEGDKNANSVAPFPQYSIQYDECDNRVLNHKVNFKNAFDENFKLKLSDDIGKLVANSTKEKQITDYVIQSITETISGFNRQEIINRTIEKFEKCKTYVVLEKEFSVISHNSDQIVLSFDHKISKYLERDSFKIQVICENKYFSPFQKSVIQQTGNKMRCVCLAYNHRWDCESKTLTLIPIALYK